MPLAGSKKNNGGIKKNQVYIVQPDTIESNTPNVNIDIKNAEEMELTATGNDFLQKAMFVEKKAESAYPNSECSSNIDDTDRSQQIGPLDQDRV